MLTLRAALDVPTHYISSQEDEIVTRVGNTKESYNARLHEEEIRRNRSRVAEINHFLENVRDELEQYENLDRWTFIFDVKDDDFSVLPVRVFLEYHVPSVILDELCGVQKMISWESIMNVYMIQNWNILKQLLFYFCRRKVLKWMMKEVYYVKLKGLGMCKVIQVLQLIYYSLFGTEKYGEEEMVKNGEICQFLDQIHHKSVHHFSPFNTLTTSLEEPLLYESSYF